MTIYNRVHELAVENNMTIAELERRAGLTSQTVSNWKRSKPSGENLAKVANVFDTSVDYLLSRTDNRMRILDNQSVNIADNNINISFNNHKLSERQRADLSVYIKTMIETNYW